MIDAKHTKNNSLFLMGTKKTLSAIRLFAVGMSFSNEIAGRGNAKTKR